ncbi:MAG: tRNA pseudouridine(38-40) synthase TruA [Clostridia bacterium]|nr:tRNA pseudouridine(38-40) synthase TruA [Clostridia bacterium]
MFYVLKIAYDGSEYAGWQRQTNALSVQECIENALLEALGVDVRVNASGRTDAGVHAAGQVCSFFANVSVPADRMPDCLNRYLPPSIRILEGWEGADGFDVCRHAKRKTYRYRLYESAWEHPLLDHYASRVETLPSMEKLQKAAKLMEGEHDFKAFCASGSSVKTTVRTVYLVELVEKIEYGVRVVEMYVTGNGFLYNMVRTMAGELLDLALGRRTEESLLKAYETGDRGLLGKTMPAKGLTMMSVEYETK